MKIAVVIFPDSNCHDDLVYVINEILDQEAVEIWHNDTNLQNVNAVFLAGGFYPGIKGKGAKIFSDSAIINEIKKFAQNGGFVLGIGSGFQLLCHLKLLQGKLVLNDHERFISKNIFIKPANTISSITALLDTDIAYKIPIAHSFGKFNADDSTVRSLRENDQILFHYCDKDGNLTEEANPDGSRANIAAICNKERNVYGIIPHPERAADDELGNTDGRGVFESIIAYLS